MTRCRGGGGVVAALTVLTFVVGGTVLPSAGAPGCGRNVVASDTADLRDAFRDAHDDAADADCATWELRISGTYLIEPGGSPGAGPLFHETPFEGTPLALRVVGPVGGTARIEADGDGTRLIDALDGGPLTIERVVLAGGSVEGLVPAPGVVDNFIAFGGAILADAVELIDSELTDNTADVGGAVFATEVRAERTSFIDNRVLGAIAQGGAIRATESVTLVNVTLTGNIAKEGGAVWLPAGEPFDATFVTFRGNSATAVDGGADLHRGLAGGGAVSLRGVLFGGVADGSAGASCGGVALPSVADGLVREGTFATDASCGEVTVLDAVPSFATVEFRPGMTDLPVPDGGPVAVGEVACDGGWPAVDQRGVARPQGDGCDAGAVERIVAPDPDPGPGPEPEPAPVEAVVDGPVPTLVPAGDGTCADGCPALSSR